MKSSSLVFCLIICFIIVNTSTLSSTTLKDVCKQRVFHPQDYGAVGNGIIDDTYAIQTAIDKAAECNGTVFISAGTYCINVSGYSNEGKPLLINNEKHYINNIGIGLSLKNNISIVLDKDAVVKALPTEKGEYALIYIANVSNVSIRGGSLVGDLDEHQGIKGQHGHCIYMQTAKDVVVRDCNISKAWGDCVYIGCFYKSSEDLGSNKSSNILIDNCKLHSSRRQGISIVGCDGIYVKNSDIFNIGGSAPQAGIDLEVNNSKYPNSDCRFENLHIFNCNGGSIIAYTKPSRDILINNCDLQYTDLRYVENISIIKSSMTNLTVDNPDNKRKTVDIYDSDIETVLCYSSFPYNANFTMCHISGIDDQPTISVLPRIGEGENNTPEALSLVFNNCKLEAKGGGTYKTTQNMFNISRSSIPKEILVHQSECVLRNYVKDETVVKAKKICFTNSKFSGVSVKMNLIGDVTLKNDTIVLVHHISGQADYLIKLNGSKAIISKNLFIGGTHEKYLFDTKDVSNMELEISDNILPHKVLLGRFSSGTKIIYRNNKRIENY